MQAIVLRQSQLITDHALNFQAIAVNMQTINENPMQAPWILNQFMTLKKHHPAFTLVRSIDIATLNISVEEYRHNVTGASHYHFAADNPENVFLVGLRTVPMDHKGVAHILEHTTLCGSRHFPVRDPFFMMIRRSLNTFMNAFTSNDWTAYPFASQNRKDFDNLLAVYLDAVFFANLNELDFLQEGHRLEFTAPQDTQSDLTWKGVVFNEMKGAMSSINSSLWQSVCHYLFPSTTYHYNSGGDPRYITDLSYQELKSFYADHYHPANAIFMTYGDREAIDHQTQFEDKVLKHFTASDKFIKVDAEKRYQAPLRIQESYPFDGQGDPESSSHLIMSWLLGQNTNMQDILKAQVLSYILMENSACPLQQYLESTPLGSAPSALGGLEDSYRELVFACGLSGAKASDAKQFFEEVLAILQSVAEKGIPVERLQAILHQLELSQREIGGDSYPYGLQIILTALPCVTHRGDPIGLLDLQPALDALKKEIEEPDFVKNLINELLLDNQHRIELTAIADKSLSARLQAAEKQQLTAIKASLTAEEKQTIVDQTQALKDRQQQTDDPEVLPKVTLSDIPDDISVIESGPSTNPDLTHYSRGTNGLVYQQLVISLPALTDKQLELLPLYCQCLPELGFADKDYLSVQTLQSEIVGNINAFATVKADLDNEESIQGYFVLSAKALNRNQAAMAKLLKDTLTSVNFEAPERLGELISQIKERKEQSVTGNGHALAMLLAAAGMSGLSNLNNQWAGIPSITQLKALDQSLDDTAALADLVKNLSDIHVAIQAMPVKFLSISEQEQLSITEAVLCDLWPAPQVKSASSLTLPAIRKKTAEAWITNTQVNFCAKAYATVPSDHPDAAPLTVLGNFLRNGFLHSAIREKGGAYGAGATQDNNTASFKFFSYRDPRLSETLADFDAAIDWLINHDHQPAQLEEAILGVISNQDKPGSPAGEAKQAYFDDLFGRTPEKRRQNRHNILAVTLADLKRVTQQYLSPEKASIGIISAEPYREELIQLNLEIKSL